MTVHQVSDDGGIINFQSHPSEQMSFKVVGKHVKNAQIEQDLVQRKKVILSGNQTQELKKGAFVTIDMSTQEANETPGDMMSRAMYTHHSSSNAGKTEAK